MNSNAEPPASGTAMLVASTGGHLDEMVLLERAFSPRFARVEWVTSDDPHSRSALAGLMVHHVARVEPRDWRTALSLVPRAWGIIGRSDASDVVSDGAAVAVPFLLAARLRRRRAHYVESVTRTEGPSMTGRILGLVPGVRVYAQYRSWAGRRWRFRGAVLDSFDVTNIEPPALASRVVVTLGTMRGFPFNRALEAVRRVLPPLLADDATVLWQVGDALAPGIDGRNMVPRDELDAAIREADLVIAHAGVGSALQSLTAGRVPVLLVRRQAHHEHVDDHQALWADELGRRGLAVSVEADALDTEHLRAAMGMRATMDGKGRVALDR